MKFWGPKAMIGSHAHEVERKVVSILKVLKDSPQPLGAGVIAEG